MNFRDLTAWGTLALMTLSGCVTTRSELNRQREAEKTELPREESRAKVESAEIQPAAPAPAALAAPSRSEASPAPPATPPANPDLTPPTPATAAATPLRSETSPAPAPVPPATAEPRPPYAFPSTASAPASSPTPAPRTDLTTLSEDELRAELAKTTGKVEELQHDQEQKEKIHAEEIRKSQDRIAELEKRLRELTPEAPKIPEGKSPMEAAKDAYAAGNWEEAIAFFTQVLEAGEKGRVAEEATYYRGESHFKKLQYNRAILDYSKFPERYQKSPYHPKALLRIAESFDSMGRKEDAKSFYSELLEKFPKTAEGRIAKKKMKK